MNQADWLQTAIFFSVNTGYSVTEFISFLIIRLYGNESEVDGRFKKRETKQSRKKGETLWQMEICDKPDMREALVVPLGKRIGEHRFSSFLLDYIWSIPLFLALFLYYFSRQIGFRRIDESSLEYLLSNLRWATVCANGCQQNRDPACTTDSYQRHNAGNERRMKQKNREKYRKSKSEAFKRSPKKDERGCFSNENSTKAFNE